MGACSIAVAAGDFSTPKNAFRTYTQSLASGDAKTLKQAVIADKKQEQLLANQLTYTATEKRFREACIKAFPAARKDLPDPTEQTLAGIEKSEVKIEGETATLTTRESLEPVRLRRVEGKWKVDLSAMYDDTAVDDVLLFRTALATVMEDMTVDIGKGKYKSFDEVRNTLEMRVKMRMALPPAEESPTTKPAE
jgi:hypothetical protein